MSLELCILASGSSGNAALLRSPGGVMLIDLGIGPRVLARRLCGTGVALADISAVCLTHLDRDHFNLNWANTLIRRKIAVYCHADRVEEISRAVGSDRACEFERLIQPFDGNLFSPLDGVGFEPI